MPVTGVQTCALPIYAGVQPPRIAAPNVVLDGAVIKETVKIGERSWFVATYGDVEIFAYTRDELTGALEVGSKYKLFGVLSNASTSAWGFRVILKDVVMEEMKQ